MVALGSWKLEREIMVWWGVRNCRWKWRKEALERRFPSPDLGMPMPCPPKAAHLIYSAISIFSPGVWKSPLVAGVLLRRGFFLWGPGRGWGWWCESRLLGRRHSQGRFAPHRSWNLWKLPFGAGIRCLKPMILIFDAVFEVGFDVHHGFKSCQAACRFFHFVLSARIKEDPFLGFNVPMSAQLGKPPSSITNLSPVSSSMMVHLLRVCCCSRGLRCWVGCRVLSTKCGGSDSWWGRSGRQVFSGDWRLWSCRARVGQ